MPVQLIVTVGEMRRKKAVRLQCCDRLLSENLKEGKMKCCVCRKEYPLSKIQGMIKRAQKGLEDLEDALGL